MLPPRSSLANRIFLAVTLGLLAGLAAHAYDLSRREGQPITWNAGTVTLRLQFPAGPTLSDNTTYTTSVQSALALWNLQLSTVQFASTIGSAAAPVDRNGVNEIGFDSTVYGTAFDANVLAVTVAYYSTTPRPNGSYTRTQADIIFNSAYTWDSYRGPLQAPEDIQRVALHELGHVLGLNHPDQATPPQTVVALMNSTVSNLDVLAFDDISGAQSLYGAPNVAPAFYYSSDSVVVYAGQTPGFSVGVNGSPAPTLQWQRRAAGTSTWSNLSESAVYVGTTSATLSVSSASLSMSGDNFRCVATNSTGSATSVPAGLTVLAATAPSISALPATVNLTAGDTLYLSPYVSGTTPIAYQWKRNGTAIAGATTASYYKAPAEVADTGQYTLTATNAAGTATSSIVQLTVTPPVLPEITGLPTEVGLSFGSTLSLGATVTGSQPMTLQWSKDGVAIPYATSSSYYRYAVVAADSGLYTLTATNAAGTVTSSAVNVKATAPINVVKLADDPIRPRMYALIQNGSDAGTLLAINPASLATLSSLTLGSKPADFAISSDGNEMLVICIATPAIQVIDLRTLQLTETLPLTEFGQWNVADTSAHVKYGPGNLIYYTDGNWAPILRAYNRVSHAVVQSITSIAADNSYGFGDFALTPDKRTLLTWGQYGWTAGLSGSNVARFPVALDGTLGAGEAGTLSYPNFLRDPLNTPVLITPDGTSAFIKQHKFATASVAVPTQTFTDPALALSPTGAVVVSGKGVYSVATDSKLMDLTPTASVAAITSDSSCLVYFDAAAHQLRTVDLIQNIGAADLGLTYLPADASIVLPPTQLGWSAQSGISKYRVYLGTNRSAVAAATFGSPEYLGEVTTTSFTLPSALATGTVYYWRVDAVSNSDVSPGIVFQFTVSSVAPSLSALNATTVAGDKSQTFAISLTSAAATKAWTATTTAPWITLTPTSGATPSTLTVKLDARIAPVGLNRSTVTVTGPEGSFDLPVSLRVDPLAVTLLRSVPGSVKAYAVSEQASAYPNIPSRAYLLEINTLLKRITRVVPVGSGVTDLAPHPEDHRIYVTNWQIGAVLAVDEGTFTVSRTYAFNPFGGVGYGGNDAYRISAAGPGRLVVEPADQWISISLFDTVNGVAMGSSAFQREGGGRTDPSGRFYYHGDNNSSLSYLHKIDTQGDTFTELSKVTLRGFSYYGDRTVVISDNGQRIFWNGGAFDANLGVEWSIGSLIYSTSSDGRYAFGSSNIFDVVKKQVVGTLPVTTTVSAFNSLTAQLIFQNGTALQFLPLSNLEVPELAGVPANGAVTLPISSLQWTAIPGATAYRVYLGTSESAVAAATTSSPEYLGQSSSTSFTLNPALTSGGTYFWRVDAVVGGEAATGFTRTFVVSGIVPSLTKIERTTVAGFSNTAVNVALSSAVAGKNWTASASVPWIKFAATAGTTPGTLNIQLDASTLPSGTSTGSITVTSAVGTFQLPVSLQVDPLALTRIQSDPGTTKVYAISEEDAASYSGLSRAYLLEIDTLFKRVTRVVPVGTGVTDLAIHHADGCVYVTNWRTGSLLGVDLASFTVTRTFSVEPFGDYSSNDAFRISAAGAGRLIVEPQDQWISIYLFDTINGAAVGSSTFQREGGGRTDPSGRFYYHGDNNSSLSYLHKFDTQGDTFTELSKVTLNGLSYYGDRTVVVSDNGQRVFWNGGVFDPNLGVEWSVGTRIYSASSDGRYAFGATDIFDVVKKQVVGTLPATTTGSAFNSLTAQLVFQNGTALQFLPLPNLEVSELASAPANGAVTLPISSLQWTAIPGATAYRVYLGTSESAVAAATTSSPEYLGQSSSTSFTLNPALTSGGTYFWRVDAVVGGEAATGFTRTFVVSGIVPSLTKIERTTVAGFSNTAVNVALSSAVAGKNWTASASVPWIKFAATAGTTPGTLNIQLDASTLPSGTSTGSITVTSAVGTFQLPVSLQVDPLALTKIQSDPTSAKVYAISEEGAAQYTGQSRAYLLEIDTLTRSVTRVVPVGTGVTDLAIHHADGRIYVTNWRIGSLLGVDLTSFTVNKTFAVEPFYGGYGSKDAYRISDAGAGRLIVEPEDQWISISLFDTVSGSRLGTPSYQREGGGHADGTGRYYYHGDNNSSGATLHKFDTDGNVFTELTQVRPDVVNYYGDRTVVVAENGQRVFWNGFVFDANLTPEWKVGEIVYCASPDGRYAFAGKNVYDVVQKTSIAVLPVTTSVSAFNGTTAVLVIQNGTALQFFSIPGIPTPPRFLAEPTAQGVRLGQPVTFTTSVEGTPAPTYQWYKNGVAISGATGTSYTINATRQSDAGGYQVVATNLAGSVTSSMAVLAVYGPHFGDFNSDGKPDLVWSNSITGERALWLMNGTNFLAASTLGIFPLEWTVAATGDFNGDGKPDLIWSNRITGERALWLMNGTNLLGVSTLGIFPLEWTVAATADFNADGRPDIIWSNSITGERAIWLMNGTQFLGASTLGTFPLEWTVAATGDFNADGKPDIIWSNSITGERAIWLMNGTNFLAASTLGTFPLEWTVAGTADFNADGKPDIIWSNSITGERALWLMNGTNFLSASTLGIFPLEWTVSN